MATDTATRYGAATVQSRTDLLRAEFPGATRHRPSATPGSRPGAAVGINMTALVRIAVLLTTVVVSFFLLFSPGADADSAPRETVLHVVQPGDTLWDLATRYTPTGGDVRATVSLIRDLNGLAGSSVTVGDALTVPTSG